MLQSVLAQDGWIGHWSPGIGDPTPIGWVTVFLYALAAWQSYHVATGKLSQSQGSERIFWWVLALGLTALGINKQLDLQSALTEIGRIAASQQGWYAKRREVQIQFIYGVATFACVIAFAMGVLARKHPLGTKLALLGSVFLLAFVVIRAASFHHFDQFIRNEYLGFQMNWILEIGGIGIIILGASWRLRTCEPVPRQSIIQPKTAARQG